MASAELTKLPPCCADAPEPPCLQHRQAASAQRHQGPRARSYGNRVVSDSGKATGPPAQDSQATPS